MFNDEDDDIDGVDFRPVDDSNLAAANLNDYSNSKHLMRSNALLSDHNTDVVGGQVNGSAVGDGGMAGEAGVGADGQPALQTNLASKGAPAKKLMTRTMYIRYLNYHVI